MPPISRRGLLAGTVLGGTAVSLTAGSALAGHAVAGSARTGATAGVAGRPGCPDGPGAVTIDPDDPRYADLMRRGMNRRFIGRPDSIRLVTSTRDVVRAVQDAVSTGARLAVRSGGHCFEDFVDDPAVGVLIDMSAMRAVGYDSHRRAFVIEPGATLGEVYRTLYYGWGVTVPGGGCSEVGVGGHFCGGGYGPLSRLHGSVVDYLYAVEVVVVDRRGRAKAVVATREADDPNHDLWWAHTGGGGGNFGVVTRYWLRAPGTADAAPGRQLPTPPDQLLTRIVLWSWEGMSADSFSRLLENYGTFFEQHSDPDSPYCGMYGPLLVTTATAPEAGILLPIPMDASVPDAERLLDEFVTAVTDGVEPAFVSPTQAEPWFESTMRSAAVDDWTTAVRNKNKAAYHRKGFTEAQRQALYESFTTEEYGPQNGVLLVIPYGGQVNTVAPDATAMPQRDSILKVVCHVGWEAEADDERHLAWSRALFASVYADTGGVPAPDGEVTDGSYINYPDVDLADPEVNASGIPWHALYYKGNYPRLQQVKAAWDPNDVFGHKLAIRPPESGD